MSYGARVRILGAAWNVVKVQGKRHSPLVVSKDRRGEGEGETVSGRRTERWRKVLSFLFPLKIQAPFFLITSPRKRETLF